MNNQIANVSLIKAGAGAGKTHHIQETLTQWVKDNSVQANRILAVTFTNAAASEMRQRIKLALLQAGQLEQARELQNAVITTIHAFGLDILQRFAFEQGLSPAPRQLSDSEQQYLLTQIFGQLESLATLVNNAERFGYGDSFAGDEFKGKTQVIQDQILKVINTLRSIDKADPEQTAEVLQHVQARLKALYGKTDSAAILNSSLITAIKNARQVLTDQPKLQTTWTSNAASEQFVKAILTTNLDTIDQNWKDWVLLQDIGTKGGVFGTKKEPGDKAHIALVEAVMNAAQQLPNHPGPLQDALDNLQYVITGALESIGKYQEAKRTSGLVDYTDMVGLAHQMMHEDSWLTELASQFDCLIIDEFQDTNPLQYALLDRLHQQGVPVFIVGDLKQAIMGFQGADSRLFEGLLEQHKDTQGAVTELTSNWRSTAGLMQFINATGTALYGDSYTDLTPQVQMNSDLTPVRVLHFDGAQWLEKPHARSTKPVYPREGYQLLANEIAALLQPDEQGQITRVIDKHSDQKRAIQPSDIAVLAKNKNRLQAFAQVLRKQGISVQMQQEGFLQCPLVNVLLDALQALNNRNDQFAWAALATSPILAEDPTAELESLLQSALQKLQDSELKSWEKTFSHAIKTKLSDACQGITGQPLAEQLHIIISALDLLDTLKLFEDFEQYRANLLKLQQLANKFEQQDEQALFAMGIVGKNAATFSAWLHAMGSESNADINQQPLANPVATNSVVLSTWHSSKGLEWPVVVILQAEDVPAGRLPSITVEYESNTAADSDIETSGAEALLANSRAQILTSFNDKTSKQKMLDALQNETDTTAKNLYYVALTRAREQLIIPVREVVAMKGTETGRMYQTVLPVVNQLLQSQSATVVTLEEMVAEKDSVERLCLDSAGQNRCLKLPVASAEEQAAAANLLKHTVTPSKHDSSGANPASPSCTVQQHSYTPACDLDSLGYQGPANELGNWMHRLYQVHLQQPALLPRAMAMKSCAVTDTAQQQALQTHLDGFREALETQCGGIKSLHSEVPVTGLNSKGQVISGVIDLLVEDTQGNWWIVDHKTDKEAVSKGYWEQLHAYQYILQQTRNIAGCILNWTRHGELHVGLGS